MEPTDEVVEKLHRAKIEAARRQTFEQKFLAGAELFDYACEISKAGIRSQHPEFTEAQVMDELRRRLALGARMEKRLEGEGAE